MGFRFAERNIINIEIEDNTFKVQYNQELLSNITAISVKAQEVSKTLKDNDAESINNACKVVYEGIDTVLGTCSSKKIFEGRDQDIMESIDVLMYIFDEINKFKNKKLSEMKNRVPQNREQKRNKQFKHNK
ncbi:hypothetical protein JW813_05130 [Clostridium botulinum]|uniref:DUF6673 family protein n=1 Tax=Clostridium botulinum TaxID=1491 RepID=UPI0006A6C08A|nr:DUF6673 family protein [Clostridium botulinum]KAI3349034.1 hypothetical protein CIT18_10410 [Clostridium botulinum]KOM88013.1 hypothetical protein ACP51_10640 [Clostridium botulinum]KOR62003.1 hypothetical protein ADT22_05580 [Clostridium botulinum]MBY7023633.1 hypothetical protein [Clostridium botulinum]NFO41817.1 hypothetical protein [Clostridium botulinum]